VSTTKSRIAVIFADYLKRGLFTHGYCARGSLDTVTPCFEYEHLPEQRSIFDLASLTKALVTTPLVFQAANDLALPLSASIEEWMRGYEHKLNPRILDIRIDELLAHRSGLPAWRNFWICHLGIDSPSALRDDFNRRQLMVDGLNRAVTAKVASGVDVYSDVGFILLGYILEVLRAQDLSSIFGQFASKCSSDPDPELRFGVANSERHRAVPTSWCKLRDIDLVGQVHDENCAALGGIAGHAGLFGSGRDLVFYLHKLFASPIGQQILEENSRRRELPIKNPPNASLLGWRQGADPTSLPFGNGAAIGHMGFTGVAFWLWPETREYVMLLTNRVRSGRQNPGIASMRQEIFAELAAI